LQDVIKDGGVTASDLRLAGILPEIAQAVFVLTRFGDVEDEVYYSRVSWNPIALAVKLADIDDNLAAWRFRKLDHDTQVELSNKYFRARQLLTGSPSGTEGTLDFDEEGE
jgi:tryptophan 2,3-dioxygenase